MYCAGNHSPDERSSDWYAIVVLCARRQRDLLVRTNRFLLAAAPFWESRPPADINQAEETMAELRCEASGDPQPLIQWFMNGRRFDGESALIYANSPMSQRQSL